MKGQWTNVKK